MEGGSDRSVALQKLRVGRAEILQRSKYEAINILIFGPCEPSVQSTPEEKEAYEKRVEIKKALEAQFIHAGVHFPEDPDMTKLMGEFRNKLRAEAQLAATFDLVILLDVSRGVDLELDHFVLNYPWFCSIAHVFLPEQFVQSPGLASTEVLANLHSTQVEGYSKQEYERCDVATIKAVRAARDKAVDSYLKSLGKAR